MALSLRGATMLDESLLPPMVVQQIDGRQIVYLAAREAGFAPEDINIHGRAGGGGVRAAVGARTGAGPQQGQRVVAVANDVAQVPRHSCDIAEAA